MKKLFSNEMPFRGHPDKVADQISATILDCCLAQDPNTRAGIEVLGGKNFILVTGEITTKANYNVKALTTQALVAAGYDKDAYQIISDIGEQSNDIAIGVNIGGAGDNCVTWGFACSETDERLPKAQCILNEFVRSYDDLRRQNPQMYYSDGKAQITGIYNNKNQLTRIKTFVVCYQNAETNKEESDKEISDLVTSICNKYNVQIDEIVLNPTGRFKVGGFEGDAGATNRKISADTYQGFSPMGNGGLNGKDPTKVDISGAYKARFIALEYLTKFSLQWCSVQITYIIGRTEPVSIMINSDMGLLPVDKQLYTECVPANIIKEFNLTSTPHFYEEASMFGFFTGGK